MALCPKFCLDKKLWKISGGVFLNVAGRHPYTVRYEVCFALKQDNLLYDVSERILLEDGRLKNKG